MSTQATLDRSGLHEVTEAPPQVAFLQMLTGYWISQSLYVAAKLGIAELLKDGPLTVEQLASKCDAHAPSLYRLLRMLSSCGVFAEDGQGRFALTSLAKFLQDGPGSLRAMTIHLMEDPSWQAWGVFLESIRTGETAFQLAHGKEVFPYYSEHPESIAPFNQAMTELSEAVISGVVQTYDFSGFEKIVDVGGGHGTLLSRILDANKNARGVIFDLPPTGQGAKERLEASGLATRCDVVGGDFFEAVPAGGDAYILKNIIHDWDDDRAIAILRNVHRAMREGGRLLLAEIVVPAGNGPSLGKLSDLHMLVMTGGRERTEMEYRALLDKAGFELSRVLPTGSFVDLVEGVRA